MRAPNEDPSGQLDDRSFEAFYRAEFDRLFKTAVGLVGRDDAFDLAQEAFARTWANWDKAMKLEAPIGFTLKIALNLARSAARRRMRWDGIAQLLRVQARSVAQPEDPIELALSGLSSHQRRALILCDYLGYGSSDAARIMGIASSTVRVHLVRARQQVRQRLEAESSYDAKQETKGNRPTMREAQR